MNGILARIGVEQLVLIVLALAAVLAVLADLGGGLSGRSGWCLLPAAWQQ